uniref:non-specific serine/threonine protein kinase n=1 Tax=Oryza meridionalis TaxID=40149 RepID=A0A0E0E4W3_9ORYZ
MSSMASNEGPGEHQENTIRDSDEAKNEDCSNSGSVTEAVVSSEEPSDRSSTEEPSDRSSTEEPSDSSSGGDSNSQSADSDGGSKEAPKMDSKAGNDDSSECTDQSSPRAVLDISVSGSVDSDESSSVEEPAESNHNTQMRSGKNQIDCGAIAPEILPEISKWRPSWRSFDYSELCAATDKFSSENLIGKGGHAEVYKGHLADGQFVAVKRLTKGGNKEDRISDFLSELGIIAHVNHPNAAQLLGFSVEGGLHLVLQFSPHGSLASVLHGTKGALKWKARFNIALGIAEGLLYLHEGCHRRIIHRDIKASNILLTEDYQPQISDFGLAKWLPDKWTHHVVFPIEGTFGYMSPEYFMHGIINEKTDVFAYGVLLLELVTGRKAVDSSRQSLAKPLLDSNNMKELVDPSLDVGYDPEEMAHILAVASMCIHHSSSSRPSMKSVVRFLKGDRESLEMMQLQRPKLTKPLMFDSGDSEDYTRSSYLNDLDRHKKLALEQ